MLNGALRRRPSFDRGEASAGHIPAALDSVIGDLLVIAFVVLTTLKDDARRRVPTDLGANVGLRSYDGSNAAADGQATAQFEAMSGRIEGRVDDAAFEQVQR